MFEPTWIQAFEYVRQVKDCELKHALWLSSAVLDNIDDDPRIWDQLEVDLGNRYISHKCYEAAELVFSGLIGRKTTPDIQAKAKVGLDRALSHQR